MNFFVLSTVKSFEIFPKHNEYGFFFRVLCLKLIDFYTIRIQKIVGRILVWTQILFLDLVQLTKYLTSVVTVELSNPSVSLSPRTRISFFLLSVCFDELLFTPKITFLTHSLIGNENCERASNPRP